MIETARGTIHEWQRDHMGHINVRAYMDFFDQASWQFYTMIGITPSLLRSGKARMAGVQQNITYSKELFPGDTIAVRSGTLGMRGKVLRFRHELFNTETGDLCSTCDFTVVCLDPETRRSQPFPEKVAAKALEFLMPETPAQA